MFALLSPRLWLLAGLVALLAFTHITVYRKGSANVRAEWKLSVAAANEEARRLEQARQRRVDDAARAAAAREAGLRADAVRAAGALRGLRAQLASLPACGDPGTAADNASRTVRELFDICGEALGSMAAEADRARSEALMLREAWPK
jgi:hypothetical protein